MCEPAASLRPLTFLGRTTSHSALSPSTNEISPTWNTLSSWSAKRAAGQPRPTARSSTLASSRSTSSKVALPPGKRLAAMF
ncbi:UNVERIFIED_CONTAM: hypothetical protein GTU68_053100 [Idotea baltica]|nr:hypothetical protein [Idotea baltica]